MKILLVDDLPEKIKKIVALLTSACKLSRDDIIIAQTAIDARRILQDTQIDLMILDILLPLRAEDAPSSETSLELLDEVAESDLYLKPSYILGLTAYQDAAEAVSPRFRERLWAVIHFDEITNEWVSPILNCVEYIRQRNSQSNKTEYNIDLCIVVALENPELKAILRLPWNWGSPQPLDDTSFVRFGKFKSDEKEYTVACTSASRMGMVATGLLTSKVIFLLRPRFVVMAGICAGIKDKTRLGDVIFCDPTWDWQSGKRAKDKENSQFAMAPHQLAVPEFLRGRALEIASESKLWAAIRDEWPTPPSQALRMMVGPIASGSAVLADGQVVSEIRKQERNLLGIEMECYGLFAAAASSSHPRPTPAAFKAVCDFADPDKSDDLQAYAAYTSASALKHFFERYMHGLANLAGT